MTDQKGFPSEVEMAQIARQQQHSRSEESSSGSQASSGGDGVSAAATTKRRAVARQAQAEFEFRSNKDNDVDDGDERDTDPLYNDASLRSVVSEAYHHSDERDRLPNGNPGTIGQFWCVAVLAIVLNLLVFVPVYVWARRRLAWRYGAMLGTGLSFACIGMALFLYFLSAEGVKHHLVYGVVAFFVCLCVSPVLIMGGLNGWVRLSRFHASSQCDVAVLILAFLIILGVGVIAAVVLVASGLTQAM